MGGFTMNMNDVLNFVKAVIKNGVENDLNEETIKNNLTSFRNYLTDRNLISDNVNQKLNKVINNFDLDLYKFLLDQDNNIEKAENEPKISYTSSCDSPRNSGSGSGRRC